jgi:hypothetical protein
LVGGCGCCKGTEGAWDVWLSEFFGGEAEERRFESASNVGGGFGVVVGEEVGVVGAAEVGGWAFALGGKGVDVEMGTLLALERERSGGWLLRLVLLLEVLEVLEDVLVDNCLVLRSGGVVGGACGWWEELGGHALGELVGNGLDDGL